MGRPTGATYDQIEVLKGLQERKHMYIHGIVGTCAGTSAANAVVTHGPYLPSNSNVKVTGVTYRLSTGGTGAATAPSVALVSSLAGTGAPTVVASAVWGTRADGDYVAMTVSSSDVAAGYTLGLGVVAGTVAEAGCVVNDICIEYKEDWD